jgi:hypothetical protein
VKLALAAVAAVLLVPVVLVAAAIGALGGSEPSMPIGARGAAGLAVAAAQAGFTGEGLRVAVAVGLAESGGNPTASGPNPPTPGCPAGSTDRGAWQLNTCYHPEVADGCADDLACAARETYRISAGGSDWSAWTTYISGAYQDQLAAADQAIATLAAPSAAGGVPPGYGTPGPCGLSPATDYAKHLVTELFGITDIDVMVGTKSALGWQVAHWAAANAAALHVKYVIFAGQIVDFREPTPGWHACRDPASSCAQNHFNHVHISFNPNA